MDDHFQSDAVRLAAHACATTGPTSAPAVVLMHGYPSGSGSANAGLTLPQLADTIAATSGCSVLTFSFRGCGASEGDFSIGGWIADIRSAIQEAQHRFDPTEVWLVGFGTGGTLSVQVASEHPEIGGIATLGSPRGLRDWTRDPGRLIRHARGLGLIRSKTFPTSVSAWAKAMKELDSVRDIPKVAPRPILLVHGADDDSVPVEDSRLVAEAAGESADLRVIPAAGHLVRYDPRAIATLLGWLERTAAR